MQAWTSLSPPRGPVVVGVDGSRSALNAVTWAVAEAVDRDVSLRIVHALAAEPESRPGKIDAVSAVLARAEDAAHRGECPPRGEVVSPVPEATVARCAIAGHDITSSVRPGVPLRSDSVAAAETPVGDRLRPPSA